MTDQNSTPPTTPARPAALIQAETWIGLFLRFGVLFCGLVIAGGVCLSFFRGANQDLSRRIGEVLSGKLIDDMSIPTTPGQFSDGLSALDSDIVIAAGLLCLILLPVLRVAFTVILFLMERDAIYVVLTTIVLTVLLFGLCFGKAL